MAQMLHLVHARRWWPDIATEDSQRDGEGSRSVKNIENSTDATLLTEGLLVL